MLQASGVALPVPRSNPVSDSGEIKPFEALLHVKIAKGVPVETSLFSLRKIAAQ